MQKQEWVRHIEGILLQDLPFNMSYTDQDKASFLFACDTFRRRQYPVSLHFEPAVDGRLNLHVTIQPNRNSIEITVKRDDSIEVIMDMLTDPFIDNVSIRGCGTVINTVCAAVQIAIHNGWYVKKTHMNTLVQFGSNHAKQRNTTLMIELQRGSCITTI